LQNLIVANLVPVDENDMFDYQENSFNISNYLKYLFNKKNIIRKERYRHKYTENIEKVNCFALTSMKEEVKKLIAYYDEDRDGCLNAKEYASIFDELKNTMVTEVQMSDSFALVDDNMDGI